jgi:hypothetical protein
MGLAPSGTWRVQFVAISLRSFSCADFRYEPRSSPLAGREFQARWPRETRQAAATKSFNGKPKASAWRSSAAQFAHGRRRLRLAVKRRCAHGARTLQPKTLTISPASGEDLAGHRSPEVLGPANELVSRFAEGVGSRFRRKRLPYGSSLPENDSRPRSRSVPPNQIRQLLFCRSLAAQSDSPSARGGWGLMPRNKNGLKDIDLDAHRLNTPRLTSVHTTSRFALPPTRNP